MSRVSSKDFTLGREIGPGSGLTRATLEGSTGIGVTLAVTDTEAAEKGPLSLWRAAASLGNFKRRRRRSVGGGKGTEEEEGEQICFARGGGFCGEGGKGPCYQVAQEQDCRRLLR